MYTNLSVNINKIATLRNSRGGDMPNVLQFALDCERLGADGITVHPRPDERHIRYADVYELKKNIVTELNIEGNPREQKFIDLVLSVLPAQVTLVPDANDALTSDAGWNCKEHEDYLRQLVQLFHSHNIRTSIFINPDKEQIDYAKKTHTNRIEMYTGYYAKTYPSNKEKAIAAYVETAKRCTQLEIEINAGHDLSQENLAFFKQQIPTLSEVSIGHALISDALYLGIANTIQLYKRQLNIDNEIV